MSARAGCVRFAWLAALMWSGSLSACDGATNPPESTLTPQGDASVGQDSPNPGTAPGPVGTPDGHVPVPPGQKDAGPSSGPPTIPGLDSGPSNPAPGPGAALDGGLDAGRDSGPHVPTGSVCPAAVSKGDPLAGAAQPMMVRAGFNFIEGPVWHAELGVLFFSDMDFSDSGPSGVASRIHRFTPPDGFEVFIESSGSNGLALTLDGKLLAATHDQQTLSVFDPVSGARTTRTLSYQGKAFNSPNDLVVRSDGNIYFTDPDWQLPPRASETMMTGVYRVNPAGAVSLVIGTLDKPNGIALSPAEDVLYVGSAGADVLSFPVAADGQVGASTVFASPGASDGMAVDCAGNLYVTAGAVVVYRPDGGEWGRLTVPSPSNLAFGGPERRTLYITAQQTLFAVELAIPGMPY